MKKKNKVYGVFDGKHLVAYHEEKRAAMNYVIGVWNSSYKIKKLHKQKLKTIPDYEDLYLVRFGRTFIQVGYLSYAEEDQKRILNELYFVKDILRKYVETEYLTDDKERQLSLLDTIDMLDEQIELEEFSVDPPEVLEEIKRYRNEFRSCIQYWDKDDPSWTQ